MQIYVIAGEDTYSIFDRVLNDFADDDVSTITLPNDRVTMKTGKNGNTIYSKNAQGINGDSVIRIIKGSSDDRFLQGKLNDSEKDFAATELANGQFVKRLGDGEGNISNEVYTLRGGIITKIPESKENVSGDTVQGVSIYTIKYALVKRNIQ
jgi:hypothetical protein